ncbi:MAG: hypothetical protein HZB13_15005 [Acidobacteria bacterium]|nr:hypothetical protein [Acidobacteriota bacterium]
MLCRSILLLSLPLAVATAADSVFVPGAFNGKWVASPPYDANATFAQSTESTIIPLMNAIGGPQWAEQNCPPATEKREFYSGGGQDAKIYACTNGNSFVGIFTDSIDGKPGTGTFSTSVPDTWADSTATPFFDAAMTTTLQGSATLHFVYNGGGIVTPLAWQRDTITLDSSSPRDGAYLSAADPLPAQFQAQAAFKLYRHPQASAVVVASDRKGTLVTSQPVSVALADPSRQSSFTLPTASIARALESPVTLRAELRGPAGEIFAMSKPATFTMYTPPAAPVVSVYPTPWTYTITDGGFGSTGVLSNFYVYCPASLLEKITAVRLLNGAGNDWLENVHFYKDGSFTPGGVGFRLNTPAMAYGVNWNAVRLQWPGGQLDVPIVITRRKAASDKQLYVYPQSISLEVGGASNGFDGTYLTVDGAWGAPAPPAWTAQASDPSLILVSDFNIPYHRFSARVNEAIRGKYLWSGKTIVSAIQVTAPGYEQQMIPATVRFLPRGEPIAPILNTAALLFRPGDPARPQFAAAQTITVSCQSSADVQFYASAVTANGFPWLRIEPSALESGGYYTCSLQGSPVTIRIDPSAIPGSGTGNQRFSGVVNFRIGNEVRPLRVTYIEGGSLGTIGSASSSRATPRQAAACAATQVFLTETELPDSFSISANAPRALMAEVWDDCGAWRPDATVTANFSNGDSPIQLRSFGNGSYSAVWTPALPLVGTRVTVQASSGTLTPAEQTIRGDVLPDDSGLPVLEPDGVLSSLNPKRGAALSPGMVAAIYGRNMSGTTELLIGGIPAYLFSISDTQLLAQIPTELEPDRNYSVVLTANDMAATLPGIYLAPVQPGVAASDDGRLIARHTDGKPVDASNPAKPGEEVILDLVGMGATTPAIATGKSSPSDPPATTVTLPEVTIDGQNAQVLFSGLTPGGIGLYQINLIVPGTVSAGEVDVQVTQQGVAANAARLMVGR